MASKQDPPMHTAHKLITSSINVSKSLAIGDSGTTGHFVVEDALVTNVRPTQNPVRITCPNGQTIRSTHECNLDIPWLPAAMTDAHIVPGLAHSSLISIKKFCDAGCRVIFDRDECRVYLHYSVAPGMGAQVYGYCTLPQLISPPYVPICTISPS